MKILVTGGCGFIGSNFILSQILNNNKILNLDNLTYAGNLDNLSEVDSSPNYKFIKKGNIANKVTLKIFQIISIILENGMFILGVSLPKKM